MSKKLAIRFDGPPSNESGRFIEVELDGVSINYGEWEQDGDDWLLVLPDADTRYAQLEGLLGTFEDQPTKFLLRLIALDMQGSGTREEIKRARGNWLIRLAKALGGEG